VVTLSALWLPILLSAIAAWILNAVFWTASPHHKTDWKALPEEGGFLAALRSARVGPGMYHFPRQVRGEKGADPAARAAAEAGPAGFLVVRAPGTQSMGTPMVLSFVLNLVVAVLVAYVASVGLAPGTSYIDVFRLVTTVVFAAYAVAKFSDAIWFGYAWSSVWKNAVDAAIIALVTGGIFGWLWPI
jgi:hypothetical protein